MFSIFTSAYVIRDIVSLWLVPDAFFSEFSDPFELHLVYDLLLGRSIIDLFYYDATVEHEHERKPVDFEELGELRLLVKIHPADLDDITVFLCYLRELLFVLKTLLDYRRKEIDDNRID